MKISFNTVNQGIRTINNRQNTLRAEKFNSLPQNHCPQMQNHSSQIPFNGWFQSLRDYFPKKLERRRERRKEEQFKKIENSIHDDVSLIAARQGVSLSAAKEKYEAMFNQVSLPLQSDGKEVGLNKVIGYSYEKYQIMKDLLLPLLNEGTQNAKDTPIPNGILIYGPTYTGKTHFANALGEHLEMKGLAKFIEVRLSATQIMSDDPLQLYDTFMAAEKEYKLTGKRQILFFDDVDEILNSESYPNVAGVFLALATNCAKRGITWIATTTDPKSLDTNIYKPFRLNSDIYINHTSDAEKSAVMSYFWKLAKREDHTNHDKILDNFALSGFHFYPLEMEEVANMTDEYLHNNSDKESRINRGSKEKSPVETEDAISQINMYIQMDSSAPNNSIDAVVMEADDLRDYVKTIRGEKSNDKPLED